MQNNAQSHVFYQTRLHRPRLDRAEGVYLWDVNGKRYFDGCSGAMVSNVGHSNPRVLDAMRRQMEKSTFGYRLHFENDAAEELARRVAELAPAPLDRVFYVSGGSEAVESCIKMARQYAIARGEPERYQVISRYPSYHGSTLGALAITGYDTLTEPFAPMLRTMPKIPAPTCYLDRDNLSDAERGLRYANMLADKIEELGPSTVLAFVVEPIGGASTGALVAPDTYLPRIREICNHYGILLIADEVMTGAGRTGQFLGCDHWQVVPDIAALAKGFGAGYVPLGAMLTRADIVDAVLDHNAFQHGFTSAGNPLACATGLAVVKEIVEQDLIANTRTVGAALKSALAELMDEFPFVGDVRGKGLLLAMELVQDRESMEVLPPAMNAANRVVDIAYDRGLIVYARRTRGGNSGDHLMVCPPLITTLQQVDEIIEKLRDSLRQFSSEL
ncbi:aminotransferase family protein [Woeseia oceani]|uniref:Aminotransferase n=1 Tax=Woeseia oceani TaxID=1548547 RepID=A0A193LJB1_9GAMM|nr:aspartate aminotransferase family protein [Woeseia oceani]ANO52484.1 aminotransferase [Woeseia oceani]